MFNFFNFFLIFYLMLSFFCGFNIIDFYLFNNSSYIVFFYLVFLFNISYVKHYTKKLDIDLFFKYFILFLKTPNFIVNYIYIIFKKVYLYLIYIKYFKILNTLKFFIKFYSSNSLLIWKPLFKKTSYFGYFRLNRNKWLK